MGATLLVTGGTGLLGSAFVARAREAGYGVRIMSRRTRTPDVPPEDEWVQADLTTGEGLEAAMKGVDVIMHAASASGFGNFKEVDEAGTRRLLEAASQAAVQHFIYPSIVGVDEIPLGYYAAKRRIETAVLESNVPATVVRATQFHAFVLRFIRMLGKSPVLFVPAGFLIQSVCVEEFAAELLARVEGEPAGRAPDVAGPEIMALAEMARVWAQTCHERRAVLGIPLPGETAKVFRAGGATNPQRAVGQVRWQDWLQEATAQ